MAVAPRAADLTRAAVPAVLEVLEELGRAAIMTHSVREALESPHRLDQADCSD